MIFIKTAQRNPLSFLIITPFPIGWTYLKIAIMFNFWYKQVNLRG